MRAVAAIPAAGLIGGAAIGLLAPRVPFAAATLLIVVAAAASAWAAARRRDWLLAAAVAAGFAGGGALLSADAWEHAWRPPLKAAFERLAGDARSQALAEGRVVPVDNDALAFVEGTLRSDAAIGPSGVSLSIAVDRIRGERLASAPDAGADPGWQPTAGGMVISVAGALAPDRADGWRGGRRVRLPAALRRPARYLDEAVPDGERALARRGTALTGTCKSSALVEIVAIGSRADEAFAAARAFARRAIAAAVGRWSPRSAAIVAAIVIGDRAGLDPDVQRRLQEAGTYHVIAISGGNIAILAAVMIGAFRWVGLLGRAAMLSAIGILLAYARLVGGGASVDRATIMAVVYFAARAIDQRSDPLNALASVAAILVAADPLSVADPAFLLTFGATLAILIVAPRVPRGRVPSWAEPALGLGAASLATEGLLFPVAAFVFSRVTFAGLALNFAAIPLMAVAQLAGMAVVPAAAVSVRLAAAVGWAAHAGAEGLVRSADLVRVAPAIAYRVAAPNPLVCAAYYLALAAAWRIRRLRGVAVALALASALWILAEPWTVAASRGDGRLHVTFIDVGQGDSAFVRFPRGSAMLVDAGGLGSASSFDIGDRVVAPVLRAAGVRRLDEMVLTHGDPDHVGGAPAIVDEFRPVEVWEGIPVPRAEPLAALRHEAQTAGLRWANVRAGDHVSIDEVDVRALHPRAPEWERQKVRNDDSIVLELRWRDVSVLFTGDIGQAVERSLSAELLPARLRVLKVPHHGSLTSSSEPFVRAVHPDVAVISAGRANHYGHPAPAVLDRYRAVGTAIFRTDQDGAITIDSDGRSLTAHSFTGRTLSLSR